MLRPIEGFNFRLLDAPQRNSDALSSNAATLPSLFRCSIGTVRLTANNLIDQVAFHLHKVLKTGIEIIGRCVKLQAR